MRSIFDGSSSFEEEEGEMTTFSCTTAKPNLLLSFKTSSLAHGSAAGNALRKNSNNYNYNYNNTNQRTQTKRTNGKTRRRHSAPRRDVTRACGIIGVMTHGNRVSTELYEGLLMLQHRGQDSAGMVTYDGSRFKEKKDNGPTVRITILRGVVQFITP